MTATATILSEVNTAYGSASSKAFVAAVCEGEGGTAWNILFSSGTLLAPSADIQTTSAGRFWIGPMTAFPQWGGAELKSGSMTHAAGAPQFEPATYADISKVSGRAAFEAQDQIQNAWDLANQAFSSMTSRLTLHETLEAGGNDLLLIPTYMGKIWIGGCDSGFPKRFTNNLALVRTTVTSAMPTAAAVLQP